MKVNYTSTLSDGDKGRSKAHENKVEILSLFSDD
jgi:hypothetical protein